MKKANFADRSSVAKAIIAPKNVDEYLARVPEPARGALNKFARRCAPLRCDVPVQRTVAGVRRAPQLSCPSSFRPTVLLRLNKLAVKL